VNGYRQNKAEAEGTREPTTKNQIRLQSSVISPARGETHTQLQHAEVLHTPPNGKIDYRQEQLNSEILLQFNRKGFSIEFKFNSHILHCVRSKE